MTVDHAALDAVLGTAATLLGMEVVFLGGLTDDTFTFTRVHTSAEWEGFTDGKTIDRQDSFCHRMLAGATSSTSDAANDPDYADAPARAELGITSYVGVPVRDGAGEVVATLCGVDRRGIEVSDDAIEVLRHLAQVVSAQLGPLAAEGVTIHRNPSGGWEVAGTPTEDLTSAMVLADLLAAEVVPAGRPGRDVPLDEVGQLRLSVQQLEHALAARVVVEQAIGVLSERLALAPRASFELLRTTARAHGAKVHVLSRQVVSSAGNPSVVLPTVLRP